MEGQSSIKGYLSFLQSFKLRIRILRPPQISKMKRQKRPFVSDRLYLAFVGELSKCFWSALIDFLWIHTLKGQSTGCFCPFAQPLNPHQSKLVTILYVQTFCKNYIYSLKAFFHLRHLLHIERIRHKCLISVGPTLGTRTYLKNGPPNFSVQNGEVPTHAEIFFLHPIHLDGA